MAGLVLGLLLSLTAAQSSQHVAKHSSVCPKTFLGSHQMPNSSKQPSLYVDLDGPVAAYTMGVLSTRLIPSLYILTMAVGIPSNAYILAFLRVRLGSKSISTVVLYLNLALSDLLLILALALRAHYHLNSHDWIFGEISCRLITALFYGNVYCSAQTIACISLKRYLAVAKPFLYRRMAKTKLAVWMCLVVWILLGAAVLPELLIRQSYNITQLGITTCHDVLPLKDKPYSLLVPYRLTLVVLGSIVPFMICVCTHVAVVYQLGQSACDWRPFIRVSTLVFFIFVVCFLPSGILHTVHYIRLFSSWDDRLYGYYRLAVCLCCFHSCLDPFLCVLLSKTPYSGIQFISLNRKRRRTPVRI